MAMERADDPASAEHAFGQRALSMRTTVLCGEDAAISLTEHRDLVGSDDVAATLPLWDSARAAQIDGR